MRLLLLLLPWLELFTLIQLGVQTSALAAIGWVLLTLMGGLFLLRRQGEGMIDMMRRGGPVGQQLMVDEMVVGLAGLLLIVPGLITDFLAVVVLIGPLRRRLLRHWRGPQPDPEVYRSQTHATAETIEGEYHRVDREV